MKSFLENQMARQIVECLIQTQLEESRHMQVGPLGVRCLDLDFYMKICNTQGHMDTPTRFVCLRTRIHLSTRPLGRSGTDIV